MFTEIFRETLQQKGITAYQVAKNTGISQGLMGEYKNGVKLPTIPNLIKIADYLDCSADYLLGRTQNPRINNSNIITTGDIQGENNVNISVGKEIKENDNQEILEMLQGLSLVERSEIILMINKIKSEK